MITETKSFELAPRICEDIRASLEVAQVAPSMKSIGSMCLFDQNFLAPDLVNIARHDAADNAADMAPEEALDVIYPSTHEACAVRSLLKEYEVSENIGDAQFAVLAVAGIDPRSVAARRLEAKWFHHEFGTHPSDHENAFEKYNLASHFLYMIDVKNPNSPKPAGVIRIIEPTEVGLKTLNILSSDEFEGDLRKNPWFEDFSNKIPGFAIATTQVRKKMIYDFFNVDPETTWDIPTMAVDEEYRGRDIGLTPAWGLHAACMQVLPAMGAISIINTQDTAPLRLMQHRFGRPWTDERTKDETGVAGKYGFTSVKYDGDTPVVPTSMPDITKACENFRDFNPKDAAALFDPMVYGTMFKTPLDLQLALYSKQDLRLTA